jgi:hypothetical protein
VGSQTTGRPATLRLVEEKGDIPPGRFGVMLRRLLAGATAARLAVLVLAVPLLLSLPGRVKHEAGEVEGSIRHGTSERITRSAAPAGERDVLVLARRVVPPEAVIGVAGPDASSADRITGAASTSWARWAAYVLAPRLIVGRLDTDWLLLLDTSAERIGVEPLREWQFGRYRLVKR